ncbi:MAG: hypothetical protein ACREA1_05600 [Nitrosotalea sp.]
MKWLFLEMALAHKHSLLWIWPTVISDQVRGFFVAASWIFHLASNGCHKIK